MIELPSEFIQTIQNTFGENGRRWLESFPEILDEASQRWGLTDLRPAPDLSYNFVAFAHRLPSPLGRGGGGEGECVLKLGVPHRELKSEIAALQFYKGRGVCRLFEADVEKGMLLLERLQPGRMLATLDDDDHATEIAADVMKHLWESSQTSDVAAGNFIRLKDWFSGLRRLRQFYRGGSGPLPERLVATAESLSHALLAENMDEVLLHGDFHHSNVLESGRGWLAIDPKGVIGPRGYEVGPFLINPGKRFLNEGNPLVRTMRRIDILSERLAMERDRIRAWAICHAVLSAWWSIEDNDPGWGEYSIRCAEVFTQVRV